MSTPIDLPVDAMLRTALDSLVGADRLVTTAHGERSARVLGTTFDTAITSVETLIELRAGNHARNVARFGTGATEADHNDRLRHEIERRSQQTDN